MPKYEADNLNTGFCEYLTKVNPTCKIIFLRFLIIAITVIVNVIMLAVTLSTIPAVSFILFVITVFIAWFLFQLTKVEYEYTIATGTFILSKIYGARVRKDVLEIKTAEIMKIVPLSDIDNLGIQKENILYTCKKDADNTLCLVYSAKGNEKRVIVICAPNKTVACLKYYRKNAFSGT